MRTDDWASFGNFSIANARAPKFVIQLDYAGDLYSFTSHSDIAGLADFGSAISVDSGYGAGLLTGFEGAGTNQIWTADAGASELISEGVVSAISSTSQKIKPLDGVAEIGGITIKLLDINDPPALSGKVRSKLFPASGQPRSLRNIPVKIYVGYTNIFADFVQIATTYVNETSVSEGVYTLNCVDVSRQLRKDIFTAKTCRLGMDLGTGNANITVNDTSEFQRFQHTDSFTDAPGQLVGYLKVSETKEIIRYTGKTATQFTGITRGALGSAISTVDWNVGDPEDDWPVLEEFIYLELPATQLAYGLITGVLLDAPGSVLPDHWHLGIDPARVDAEAWRNIGEDIYDGETGGLILRFWHLKKEDGKKFIESQIYKLAGVFAPIGRDGRMGLKRVNPVLSGANADLNLSEYQIVQHNGLKHRHSEVANQYRVDYQYDGQSFLRSVLFVDTDSINQNDTVNTKILSFKGLHNSRHTVNTIYNLVNTYVDRYRNPPQTIDIDVLPYFDILEANDIVGINLGGMQDYADSGSLSRPFEIQQTRIDWVNGKVSLNCFASSGSAGEPLYKPEQVLDDSFYTSRGTNLNSVLNIDGGGFVQDSATLTGYYNTQGYQGIYYFDGDLTIPDGVTITITQNVSLRISGALVINGLIDGAGRGRPGGIDANTVGQQFVSDYTPGNIGYIGNTRSGDSTADDKGVWRNISGGRVEGRNSTFPALNLNAGNQTDAPTATDIKGIPGDLRGTSGSSGAYVGTGSGALYTRVCRGKGGSGGDSGAGLQITARGVSFGANGLIDLSGDNGNAGAIMTRAYKTLNNAYFKAGTGAGGGPGSLLILIDGGTANYPVIQTHFRANRGSTPTSGRRPDYSGSDWIGWNSVDGDDTFISWNNQNLGAKEMWQSCHAVFYVPE